MAVNVLTTVPTRTLQSPSVYLLENRVRQNPMVYQYFLYSNTISEIYRHTPLSGRPTSECDTLRIVEQLFVDLAIQPRKDLCVLKICIFFQSQSACMTFPTAVSCNQLGNSSANTVQRPLSSPTRTSEVLFGFLHMFWAQTRWIQFKK